MKVNSSKISESVLSFSSQASEYFNEDQFIYCPQNHVSTQICQNQKCINNAFICDQKKCSCQKNHIKCFTLNKKKFIKAIQQKIISTEFLQKFIDTKIQALIKLVSDFECELKTIIQHQSKYLGLNPNEKQFLNNIQQGNLSTTTGFDIWKVIYPQYQQIPINDIIAYNLKTITNQFNLTENSMNQSFQGIKYQFITFQQKIFQANFISGKQKSKIITTLDESRNIQKMLLPQKIKSSKLLYRASENNFETKKFHQNCDGIVDTLVLVETQFDKKIGGYTPIEWRNAGNWVKDQSLLSFVFSLTENDKFQLKFQANALHHHQSQGPFFGGGHDLVIYDKANQNRSSYGNINHTYENQNYYRNDPQSWERFGGNPNSSKNFKVKEWEVWGLYF